MNLIEQVFDLVHRQALRDGVIVPTGASASELDDFEERTGQRVPAELREWLLTCNGPMVGQAGIFGIRTPDYGVGRAQDIEFWLDMYPDFKRRTWCPVASDGCGNPYLIEVHDRANSPVFFLDASADVDNPAYWVASGIWHFLELLLLRELGEARWPFDRDWVLGKDPDLARVGRHIPLPWETV